MSELQYRVIEMTSIAERILGNNSLYTENYITNVTQLTKSIVLVNHAEANLYHELVVRDLGYNEHATKREEWRYYYHLSGMYHPVDTMMKIRSLDNGELIDVTRATMLEHATTRETLAEFETYYRSLVNNYPQQELLIKSLISLTDLKTPAEITKLPGNTIIHYNLLKVENLETDLMLRLQERIYNYSITKTLTAYALADSLYMATMYTVLYQFIFTSIITIRLSNANTERANSYHYLSFLMSHHKLDKEAPYLTIEQILYLYRNTKYLNTYAGSNRVLTDLIDKFFTVRRITVTSYNYLQSNSINEEGNINYRYKQRLLNSVNFVFDKSDFYLKDIENIESKIVPSNKKEYNRRRELIDLENRYSLSSELTTKDLEINITDVDDDVKYIKEEAYIDYWAYTLYLGINSFIVTLSRGLLEGNIVLSSKDLFSLFTLCLFKQVDIELEKLPDYRAVRVLKTTLPTVAELDSFNYRSNKGIRETIKSFVSKAPKYSVINSTSSFVNLVNRIYSFNLGTWIFLKSLGNIDFNAQLENVVNNLYYNVTYTQGTETVDEFLNRISFNSFKDLTKGEVVNLTNAILREISYGYLGGDRPAILTPKALISVLSKFKSYSTQLVASNSSDKAILTNLGSPYYNAVYDIDKDIYINFKQHVESWYTSKHVLKLDLDREYLELSVNKDFTCTYDPSSNYNYSNGSYYDVIVGLPSTSAMFNKDDDWVVNPSSQSDLLFLSMGN